LAWSKRAHTKIAIFVLNVICGRTSSAATGGIETSSTLILSSVTAMLDIPSRIRNGQSLAVGQMDKNDQKKDVGRTRRTDIFAGTDDDQGAGPSHRCRP
jgi:hypothetical protein